LDNVSKLKIIHERFDYLIHDALAIHFKSHMLQTKRNHELHSCEKGLCFSFLNIHTWWPRVHVTSNKSHNMVSNTTPHFSDVSAMSKTSIKVALEVSRDWRGPIDAIPSRRGGHRFETEFSFCPALIKLITTVNNSKVRNTSFCPALIKPFFLF